MRFVPWIATSLFVILVGAKFDSATGFTSLIRFGETWQDRRLSVLKAQNISTAAESSGYDGQFYAQIALDPLLRNEELPTVLDVPSYRARRILTPAAAALAGLGRPTWVLQCYALINTACWLVLAWLLYRQLACKTIVDCARWIGCMFSMGAIESVRQSLVDLPAMLLLVLAVGSLGAKATKTGIWLGLSSLAKESNLLATVALVSDGFFDLKKLRKTLIYIILAASPIGLWSIYVRSRLGETSNGEGLGNFTWPFTGLFFHVTECCRAIALGDFDGRYTFGLIAVIGFLVQATVIWGTRDFRSPWWRIGAAYSLLLPLLSIWVWGGYWAACRAVLPLTFAFNLLLPPNRAFWPLWLLGNLTILHALWRFL